MIITATGHAVRSCLAEARRVAALELAATRELLRSGGEDGLYRVHLAGGHVVECTVVHHGKAAAEITEH